MTDEKQSSELEAQPVPQSPLLRDKRIVPEGVVPKQAQAYVVAGLAVLILMAVLFSKNHARPEAKAVTPPSPLAGSTDMNQRKIEQLEQDLNEAQRQTQQQAQVAKTNAGAGTSPAVPGSVATPSVTPVVAAPSTPAEPQRDPVTDAERALAFKSRFASNLVSASGEAARSSSALEDFASHTAPSPDSFQQLPASQAAVGGSQKRVPEVSVNAAHGQPYVLFEGTTIDTTLLNRLNGDFAGSVKVMVTNPVYSHDGQHVLIPEGTFLLGDVKKVSGTGQRRLAVTFHRMIMPDGYSVDLDQFHGLNQIGETGLNDQVNNHYLQVFGTSIALGVIAGAAEATTNSGYNESGADSVRQGVAANLSSSAAHVLDRFINILPTITIREGFRIKVYLTQDLLLPAYENHAVPGNI